ncbi:unnamed protein product [Cylicocyclus nassatus]|uniref:Uncharacterized protein n=1 Tax=Cylicocyclus nassatus TaxID=53992 RepID=A0AA36HI69_CYLNA|nr:unnamed protein product [Cylicocyclus nassatus]
MTSHLNVLMDAPTVRTRLITSTSGPQHNDYFFIYVSTIVTVTVLLSSAFLVWRWGLQGFGTHLSVALAIALLIFNAYLGAKAWSDLHQENEVFLKHQRRPMPQIRPTNKFCRDLASPVWIERNIYYEDERNGKVPASA